MGTIASILRRIAKYFMSMLLMVYAFTAGMMTRKGRYVHSLICEHFGFAFLKPSLPLLPRTAVIGPETICLTELEVKRGGSPMPVSELAVLCGIIRKQKPTAIFEIGTYHGRTTLNMALNSPEDCRVYTLDLPQTALQSTRYPISRRFRPQVEKEVSGELILEKDARRFSEKHKITQLLGDSGTFDFSPYYSAIDLVFIDGAHDYQYVLNDSRVALRLLRGGKGIILWHDYKSGMEVVTALRTFAGEHPEIPLHHIEGTTFAYAELS